MSSVLRFVDAYLLKFNSILAVIWLTLMAGIFAANDLYVVRPFESEIVVWETSQCRAVNFVAAQEKQLLVYCDAPPPTGHREMYTRVDASTLLAIAAPIPGKAPVQLAITCRGTRFDPSGTQTVDCNVKAQ